jgi:hypothetical protein
MTDVLLDSLLDTLKLAPVIIIVYLLIELLERKLAGGLVKNKALYSPAAPLVGAVAGIVPQCGFSVVSANLYAARKISLGTLTAVFIATSDEAIPVILSDFSAAPKLLPLLAIKFLLAVAVGYAVHFIFKNGFDFRKRGQKPSDAQEKDDSKTGGDEPKEVCGCHGHAVTGKRNYDFLLHPLLHSFTVLIFIFAVNFALGTVIWLAGEDALIAFLGKTTVFQPFLAALIGLIPNCASSVVISRLYAVGGLTLGAAVAGLSAGAGIGYAVLFKENKPLSENVIIIAFMYAVCSLTGFLTDAVASLF